MNEIKIKSDSMAYSIKSLQDEMERLVHYGEVVAAVPEINEMKPDVFLDHGRGYTRNFWMSANQLEKAIREMGFNGTIKVEST